MKIRISPFALLRIPLFPVDASLKQCWTALKDAIATSSPAFYEIIERLGASDLNNIDRRTEYTIWKYFNRAKYRGVPYGKFAAYGIGRVEHRKELKQQLRISNEQLIHSFPDWGYTANKDRFRNLLFETDRHFIANSSTYTVGDSIRYLNLVENNFELAEVVQDDNITGILEHCSTPIRYDDLHHAMSATMDRKDISLLIKNTYEMGLIFTDLDVNIIGEDCGSRPGVKYEPGMKTYDLAEREILEGNIDQSLFTMIPSYIEFLQDILPTRQSKALTLFKEAFVLKYEQEEVALLHALDPEMGLGYGQLEASSDTDEMIDILSFRNNWGSGRERPQYDPGFLSFLINAIYDTKGNRNAVIDIRNFNAAPSNSKLPNSLSVLVHLSDQLVIPDYIGGCTANAMTGRFTLASERILEHCRATAGMESESNPDILFFDIGYSAERDVDNINRRRSIYDQEVMMLSYANRSTDIPMNDLFLTVKDDELILFSKKYQKRAVPRMSSAYNYSRSDLSLYRFLCDLQHQNIQSSLSFSIHEVLPDLNFYPRIQFDEIVVSPAQWRISVNKPILPQLEELTVCQHFIAGTTDQTLRFDRHKPEDLTMFLQFASQNEDFYICETFPPKCSFVIDEQNNPYQAQVQLTYTHSEQLYKPYISSPLRTFINKVDKIILPGNDWIYFELYCHASRAELLLTDQIPHFIGAYPDAFKCFFFIRYNHPTPHLRLRFQLNDNSQGYFLIERFTCLFSDLIDHGLITDIQIKPYTRELNRYGEERMIAVEHFFELSSKHVLRILAHEYSVNDKYQLCMQLAEGLLNVLKLSLKQQQTVVKQSQDAFIKEHRLNNTGLKLINKEYAASKQAHPLTSDKIIADFSLMEKSFCNLITTCNELQAINLFRDLFHMHVNRMFTAQQRVHELVIYSFMFKRLLQKEHSRKL